LSSGKPSNGEEYSHDGELHVEGSLFYDCEVIEEIKMKSWVRKLRKVH